MHKYIYMLYIYIYFIVEQRGRKRGVVGREDSMKGRAWNTNRQTDRLSMGPLERLDATEKGKDKRMKKDASSSNSLRF